MNNQEIRVAVKKSGIRFWMVADELGIQDSGLSRKLRRELPATEKKQILLVIRKLAEEGAHENV